MPGKKGSGLQNLNAMKYPWRVLWRRGVLPAKYAWMRPVLEAFGDGLIQDKGGQDNVHTAKRAMIELAQVTKAAVTIIMTEAAESGYVVKSADGRTWDLHPGMKELPKFANLLRTVLCDLGLEREARDADRQIVVRRWADSGSDGNSTSSAEDVQK